MGKIFLLKLSNQCRHQKVVEAAGFQLFNIDISNSNFQGKPGKKPGFLFVTAHLKSPVCVVMDMSRNMIFEQDLVERLDHRIVSSVRSSNSHPDLPLTHHPTPLFRYTPVLEEGTYLLLVVTFYHVCRRRLPACWERILFNLDGFSHLTITPCHLQHQKTSYLWVPHSYHDCTQIRRSCLKYANCSS